MPKDKTVTQPGVSAAMVDVFEPVEVADFARNGVGSAGSERARDDAALSEMGLTLDDLQAMKAEEALSPSLSGEEELDGVIALAKPGTSYIRIHPTYELIYSFAFDFRKADARSDPFLVKRNVWPYFPPALIKIKRLLLCQSFRDDIPKAFFWLADWHESHESPKDIHRSIARVVDRGRREWGQALWDGNGYRWLAWSEAKRGVPPAAFWPEHDLLTLLNETFAGRIIESPDHPLVQAIGEDKA